MTVAARLPPSTYQASTQEVAQALLGKLLVRRLQVGRKTLELRGIIVEVEAYLSCGDEASHSHGGRKNRNASMFLAPGHLYVYPIHARHCMNVVTEEEGQGAAVLIRAMEPVLGAQHMWQFRFPDHHSELCELESTKTLRSLGQGPGRLCESLRVDRELDGIDLNKSKEVMITSSPLADAAEWSVCCGPRIGISKARNLPLRWFIDGNHFVSGCAREHSAGRRWRFSDG